MSCPRRPCESLLRAATRHRLPTVASLLWEVLGRQAHDMLWEEADGKSDSSRPHRSAHPVSDQFGIDRAGGFGAIPGDPPPATLRRSHPSLQGEPPTVHVVLVETDADALRVDLHELREGVDQAARDGDGAAHRHVHARKLLATPNKFKSGRGMRALSPPLIPSDDRAGGIAINVHPHSSRLPALH